MARTEKLGNPVQRGQGTGLLEARTKSKGSIGQSVPAGGVSGSGSGLFAGQLSARPTLANTGLGSLLGTSATATDSNAGIFIANATVNGGLLRKAAPAAPYTITVMLMIAGSTVGELGWTDGTKQQFIYLDKSNGNILVQSNTNFTTWSATPVTLAYKVWSPFMWYRIRDDGTNVTFSYSLDGANFINVYTVAKASGFLGAAGYSTIMVGCAYGSIGYCTIMSYAETS